MDQLVRPHGKDKELKPLLLQDEELGDERERAKSLKRLHITSRETGDAIMMGIGGFTPLAGFMGSADWKGVVTEMKMADGTFWPIPVTVSATVEDAKGIKDGQDVTLTDEETGTDMAIMTVTEKYKIDKELECKEVFRTDDPEHPGVAMVMGQEEVNLGGPIKVLSESYFPEEFARRVHASRRNPGRSSSSGVGRRWRRFSCATPCTAPTSTWRRSPSRPWTGSSSTSSWASSSPVTSPPTCA